MPQNIIKGQWCNKCVKNLVDIDVLRKIARDRNRECLTKAYYGPHEKHKWTCEEEHVWETTPTHIKEGA
ncbi:hypothetical protein R0K18_35165, partial [Pantoea sp. SIMBA_133]